MCNPDMYNHLVAKIHKRFGSRKLLAKGKVFHVVTETEE